MDKVQDFSGRNGWLPTLDGRKVFVRQFEGRILTHTSLNTMLQCDGAIVAKRSMLTSYEEIQRRKLEAYLMIYYHDEWQNMVRIGLEDEVGTIMVKAMEDTGRLYNMKLPITGEYKIGRNWSETH